MLNNDALFLPPRNRRGQTHLSRRLEVMWGELEHNEGHLMLFCWTRRSEGTERPTMFRNESESILGEVLTGKLQYLSQLALQMIRSHPEQFPDGEP